MEENKTQARLYELGYHLLSSVPQDEVSVEVETLKGLIAKHGGEIASEGAPQLIDLAYTIRKRFEGGYKKFDQAYFGWIKFTGDADMLEALKEDINDVDSVLRYILIKTVADNTLYGDMVDEVEAEQDREEERENEEKAEARSRAAEKEKAEKGEVEEEELDSKLDEIVSDDTVKE